MYLENVARAGRTHRRIAVNNHRLLTMEIYSIDLVCFTLDRDTPAIFHRTEIKDTYAAAFLAWRQTQCRWNDCQSTNPA